MKTNVSQKKPHLKLAITNRHIFAFLAIQTNNESSNYNT